MAQKKRVRTERAAKNDLVKLFSFFGIAISAVVFLVGGILSLCAASLGNIGGILNLVASLMLLIAVAFPAYDFIRGKSKAWRIAYWVFLVIYVVGCVLGLISFR